MTPSFLRIIFIFACVAIVFPSSAAVPSSASAAAVAEEIFFPYSTVEVSQWTTEALYNRFFASSAHSIVETNVAKTIATWRSAFDVQLYSPCHMGNFVTTIMNQGSSSTPAASHTISTPRVVLLGDRTLGLFGQVNVSSTSSANAWFVEGVCLQKDCKCKGFPVEHLCTNAKVTMTTTINFRIRVDLNPSSDGLLPLHIVEVFADGPVFYGNDCSSMNKTAADTLPWFAQKFNDTFQDLLQDNYLALIPNLHKTVKFSLESFVNGSVHSAMKRYFPASVMVAGGTVSKYRVNATFVNSTASPTLGTADRNAYVAWNVTAAFSYTGDSGVQHDYKPWRVAQKNLRGQQEEDDAAAASSEEGSVPLWAPQTPFVADGTATRITMTSEALQVLSWFTSSQDDMNHNANNTILDATIETIVEFGTPHATLQQSFSPIPWVNQSLPDDKVMNSIRKKQGGDGGEPGVVLTMNQGVAQVLCKNGSMSLIDAKMQNITTRTYVALQLDEATHAFEHFRLMEPSHVVSLFFAIYDFNKFQGAKFDVVRPTGGFPQSVLASMLQKAMNETRPAMNDALRATRLPLPPAAQLLLRPLPGQSAHLPESAVQLRSSTTRQGSITFSTLQTDAPPPLPLPPSLLEAVPVVLSIQHHSSSSSTTNWTSPPLHASHSRALLGQTCRVMATVNGTVFYWVADESHPEPVRLPAATSSGNDGKKKEESIQHAMWPSKVSLFCTDSGCEECQEQLDVAIPASTTVAFQVSSKSAMVTLVASVVVPPVPSAAGDEPLPLCFQGENSDMTQKATLLGDSSLCAANETGKLARGSVANILAFDRMPEVRTTTGAQYQCARMPGQSKLLIAVSETHVFAPCFTCPSDATDLEKSACPLAASQPLPALPTLVPQPAHGNKPAGNCTKSAAGESFWLAPFFQVPRCELLVRVPPQHSPSSGFNVQLWIPVIVFGLLIVGVAAAVLIRRQMKQRSLPNRSRYNSISGESTQLDSHRTSGIDADDDEKKNNNNRKYHLELGVAAAYPLIALLISTLVVSVVCGVTYWVLSPFGRYTSDRAYEHGVPHSINLFGLEKALHRWTSSIAGFLSGMASASFLTLLIVVAAVLKCSITSLRVLLSPGLLASLFAAFAVGFQFAVLSPPLGFSVKHMANVTLQMNLTTSVVSRHRLDEVSQGAASAAALLITLPTVLHLMASVASALPVAAGVACAIRAVLAAKQDTAQTASPDDVTPEENAKTVFFLLGRRHNTSDVVSTSATNSTTNNKHLRSLPDAVTSSWMMIITLCSTSTFAMTGVMALVTFQATREVTWLVFAIFRSVVSLVPLVSTYHLKEGCKLDDAKRIKFGKLLAVVGLFLDVLLSVLMAVFTSINPSFPVFALHVCALVVDVGFFFYLEPDSMAHAQHHHKKHNHHHGQQLNEDEAENGGAAPVSFKKKKRGMSHSTSTGSMANRTTSQRFVVPEAMSSGDDNDDSHISGSSSSSSSDDNDHHERENETPAERGSAAGHNNNNEPWPITRFYYRHIVDPVAQFSAPWWRVFCSAFATVFICLSYYELAITAENPQLRSQLIGIMSDNGIQFPKNISKVHLFVDPGIDAYNAALRADLYPLGIGMALAVVCTVSAIVVGLPDAKSKWRPRLTFLSRVCSIASYICLLIAALYFAVPDFVSMSNLTDIVPHCAPEFFSQGELAVTAFARIFFSSTVFGRLMPLLITFPPAIVRVLYLIGEQCGVTDQFSPMFVATLVTSLCVQLPLLSVVLIADANVVLALGAALPVSLFAVVFLFHPAIQSRDPIQGISFVWYVLYIIGWVMLVWQAIKTNEVVWTVVQRVLQSKAVWYELVSGVFMATVAFCDVVWFVVAPKDERVIAQEIEHEKEVRKSSTRFTPDPLTAEDAHSLIQNEHGDARNRRPNSSSRFQKANDYGTSGGSEECATFPAGRSEGTIQAPDDPAEERRE